MTGTGALRGAVQAQTQITTNTYTKVGDCWLDTMGSYQGSVAYVVLNDGTTPNNNSIKVKMQGSFDNNIWTDLATVDAGGQAQAAELTIANDASKDLIVTPSMLSGAASAYRFYRIVAKAAVNDAQGTAIVSGFAK